MPNCICYIILVLCIWEFSFREHVMSLFLKLCHLKSKNLMNSEF